MLVRFPRSRAEADREQWPWLAGVVIQRCGEDEWQVEVTDRQVARAEDGSPAPGGTPDADLWHPVVFRDSSELRRVGQSVLAS